MHKGATVDPRTGTTRAEETFGRLVTGYRGMPGVTSGTGFGGNPGLRMGRRFRRLIGIRPAGGSHCSP
jgi:hypothetical protein